MASSQGAPSATTTERKEKIYCANCIHCKLVRASAEDGDEYYLRVRCAAGKWRKKLGGEKIYKYFTVARRSIDECDMYEPMGDPREFIRELRKSLPIKDEAYTSQL
jgi:hypothetical protein